jgi:hypothetical protein
MRRLISALVLALSVVTLVTVPLPAFAESDRDPNDVDGPFDVRRITANFRFRGHAQLLLVVAFFADFDAGELPRRREAVEGEWDVLANMTRNFRGFFFRRGRFDTVFTYGDFGSGSKCCFEAPVRGTSHHTLKVVVRHLPTTRFRVSADTYWPQGGVIHDRSGTLSLGRPPTQGP